MSAKLWLNPLLLCATLVPLGNAAQSREVVRAVPKPISERVVGKWTVSLAIIPEPMSNPILIEDIECRLTTPGLTLVLSSKGRAEVRFVAKRDVVDGGDLNEFDLVSVQFGLKRYPARYVQPSATPKKVAGLVYKNTVPLVQDGEPYLLLDNGVAEFPSDAFFTEIVSANDGVVTFRKPRGPLVNYNVSMKGATKLISECAANFKRPVRFGDIFKQ